MLAWNGDVDVVEAEAVQIDFHLVTVSVQIHVQLAVVWNTQTNSFRQGRQLYERVLLSSEELVDRLCQNARVMLKILQGLSTNGTGFVSVV